MHYKCATSEEGVCDHLMERIWQVDLGCTGTGCTTPGKCSHSLRKLAKVYRQCNRTLGWIRHIVEWAIGNMNIWRVCSIAGARLIARKPCWCFGTVPFMVLLRLKPTQRINSYDIVFSQPSVIIGLPLQACIRLLLISSLGRCHAT